MLIALNKPYGVVCQFSPSGDHPTLAAWVQVPSVYPAGRLDRDSEGLLLLTDDGALQNRIAGAAHGLPKRYWVEVEGTPSDAALAALRHGVELSDGPSRPLAVRALPVPEIWPRTPPVRIRRAIPTAWLELVLDEGRNRQVRRTTAAVGLPTLRLIRVGIGTLDLMKLGLAPGAWRALQVGSLGLPPADPPERQPSRQATRQPTRPPARQAAGEAAGGAPARGRGRRAGMRGAR